MNRDTKKAWWLAENGKVHMLLLDYVHEVERRQSDHFDRFGMLESLYDPNGPAAAMGDPRWRKDLQRITENVIASTVDTVCSAIAPTEIRARFMTDGADWSTQRRARLLEKYAEEVSKLVKLGDACRSAFFAAAKKGTGILKLYADQDSQLQVEAVLVDNIVVDDKECINGARPKQMHYRQADFDRDTLAHQFPEHAEEIDRAQSSNAWRQRWSRWTIPNAGTRNDVCVCESWRLPMGVPDTDGYRPGRHVICIEGLDLLDEEWHEADFPFAVIRWGEREASFYGISLAERIIGHQRTLNKRNWQRDRQLDQVALPVTWVRPADINAQVKTTQAGTWIPIKGDYPKTEVPQAVGFEILQDRHDAKASAFEETGVSRMSASATKPAGLDSGVALREYKDSTTQRFARQEKAYEQLWLDAVEKILGVCKSLGKNAPKMSRQSRFGRREIPWKDVEITDVRVQIAAASTLNRTPAGRTQTVLELSQAGVISLDDARRLLQHPDLEHAMSLYTAAMEAIEEDLEEIENERYVIPEPFINLKMAVWRGTNRYLVDRGSGAPEEVLEGIRTYITQAAFMLGKSEQAANANMMASAPPAGMAMPGGPPMAMPQQVPTAAPPLLPGASAAMSAA